MARQQDGKVALITGGGQGIGQAIIVDGGMVFN